LAADRAKRDSTKTREAIRLAFMVTSRSNPRAIADEPERSARLAGLRYVTDQTPGFRRHRSGRGFSYRDAEGRILRDRGILRRIRALAIPPAWNDVWICPLPHGHIQATARDAKGRKQYRYHARWREVRDDNKFDRMIAFGEALPALRKRTDEDLSQSGLPRSKILATVVRLLELTLIRVGNEEYARANASYGLTTLRSGHVAISGRNLKFRFRGKSAKTHEIEISDRRLAAVVKRCRALPGHELFQYLDEEGRQQSIDSSDVNDYLRTSTGEDFTAKDFRTWAGSVLAAQTLSAMKVGESEAELKHAVAEAIKLVALRLGNTPATCRKHYVHPAVIDAFLSGELKTEASAGGAPSTDEASLLRVLKHAAAHGR
jgi:DNA topoisomerase-1